ncbi:MAG TPA: hypothetical protein VNV38_08460 [Stellaceae bacterium]|jgi:hypothetical protein|nr:hypothetical protein [Stellaceae bacterium]
MTNSVRAVLGAIAVAALFAVSPAHHAAASDFIDACVKGSGLFDDAGCKCLEGKVTDASDKAALLAYFKIQADAMNGKTPSSSDATSTAMSKGTELMSKYSTECVK